MFLSIVIPTFQEASGIGTLLTYLKEHTREYAVEVVVVDAQSPDGTATQAGRAGARVISTPFKSRARQMNAGAEAATGQVLYFLHADTYPPPGFVKALAAAVGAGHQAGCFRLQFDHPHWFLQAMGWFTRFPVSLFRFGDQSLFVQRELFLAVQGFKEELLVMEDQEIVLRLQKRTRFAVLPLRVTSSARKYLENGVIKLQLVFSLLLLMFYLGFSQQAIIRMYKRLISEKRLKPTTPP